MVQEGQSIFETFFLNVQFQWQHGESSVFMNLCLILEMQLAGLVPNVMCYWCSAIFCQPCSHSLTGGVVVWVETREGCSCWQQKRAFGSTEVLPPLLILYLVEGQGSHDYLFFGKNSNIFPSHVNHDCCKEIMFTFKCTASMLHILCFTNTCYPGGQLWLV